MPYVYPNSEMDSRTKMLNILGTHWAQTYAGNDVVDSYTAGRGQIEKQTLQDLSELIDTVGRESIPVLHTDRWYLLTLKKSEMNSDRTAILRYGDGAVYGNQPGTGILYKYGEPADLPVSAFPLPADVKDVTLIFNRLQDPSYVWIKGHDFTLDLDNRIILFLSNPFKNALVPTRSVFTGDEVTDTEAGLWLFQAQLDRELLHTHYGHVIELETESSQAYKELINSVWDGITGGTAAAQIQRAFLAVSGVETARESGEVVEVVTTDHRHMMIITDKHVYRFALGALPLVEPTDVLTAGQTLVDSVQYYEFNRGQLSDELRALALGPDMLLAGFHDSLTFENKIVPLEVTTDGVFTRVEFEIGGFPADVEKFWDDMHERGVASGRTLAHMLDQRTNKVGEPSAGALPATINPLQFLAENVLRNHAFVIRLQTSGIMDGSLAMTHLRLLRKLVPPHTTMIVLVELAVDRDTITMEGVGTAEEPGYEESPTYALGGDPIEEIVSPSVAQESPTVHVVEGYCL